MARRISYARGKGKLRHNNRDFISPNVDPARVQDNIVLVKQDLSEAYSKIFGEAQAAYNEKQKRSERKIADYFEKLFGEKPTDTIIHNSNNQQSFYEYVVGVGGMHDTGFASNPEAAKKAVECLTEYMQGFQQRNPNFHVFNAVIHVDEATPHLHYDYIPYADGYKKGMTRQQGIAKALEQMGYGTGKDAIKNFTQSERQVFREICEAHGFEIADEQKGRGETLTTKAYREYAEVREKTEKLSAENDKKVGQIVADFATGKGTKKVAQAEKIIENAELVNRQICEENTLKKEQLTKDRRQLEARKVEVEEAAKINAENQKIIEKNMSIIRENDKRLKSGFANLKETVEREVQRRLARLNPFKKQLEENDKYKQRLKEVQQAAEKAAQKHQRGDMER